jgi:hypothetical protein
MEIGLIPHSRYAFKRGSEKQLCLPMGKVQPQPVANPGRATIENCLKSSWKSTIKVIKK